MSRLRSVLAPPLVVAFAAFLVPLAAHATCYEPLCCTYPPVQGTTHIESVSPQVALPGVTRVYVEDYCFGDTQGGGSITLNGEPTTHIVFWTDAGRNHAARFNRGPCARPGGVGYSMRALSQHQ